MRLLRIIALDPIAWLLVLGVTAIIISIAPVYAADTDTMRKEMFAPTAQLNGNCSATLVYSKRDEKSGEVTTVFLTAKHCVVGKKSDLDIDIPVYQDNRVVKKERYIARVRGEYYAADLALVELKDKQTFFAGPAKIAPEKPSLAMGEDVWTIGYPLGASLTVTQGLFGSLESNNFATEGAEYFRATPDIAGGNSGGAMYHKAGDKYELIGVTTAGAKGYPFFGLYTPIGVIHAYLKVALPEVVAEAK